ncbi:MAG: hypothetical protein ABI834_04460 [Ginsengibacter sp.]
MNAENEPLLELQHIKKMMERSTKFSSLSGLSSIAAGICGLAGIWFVVKAIAGWKQNHIGNINAPRDELATQLLFIAVATFIAALISSFIFIYLRCKKLSIPVLGMSARRVIINIAIPLFAGSLFIFRLRTSGAYILIPPACLIFYGLALVNASKYTLNEVRYLGFTEIIIGVINLWILGYGLIFWGIGFGLTHIIYGIIIWYRYEKKASGNLPGSTNE